MDSDTELVETDDDEVFDKKNGFSKYTSFDGRNRIYDARNKLTWLDAIRQKELDKPDIKWCCYRKIDGSNFSICIEKSETGGLIVRFAKRSGFLKPDEKFQNVEKISDDLICKANALGKIVDKFEKIFVYGEIYGTVDEKLKTTAGYSKIIGRIFYGPHVYFTVYDIRIDGKFIKKSEMERIGRQAGFDVLEPMATGTLDELLKNIGTYENHGPWFPSKLVSTICERHGYQTFDKNKEEGVVLVTEEPLYVGNGNRAMIKVTGETEKPAHLKIVHVKKDKVKSEFEPAQPVPDEIKSLKSYLLSMCDEDRYYSAISKTGSDAKPIQVAGEMTRDIITTYTDRGGQAEFETETGITVSDEMLKKYKKHITEPILQTCMKLVNKLEKKN